jgi:Na+-transporting NADH:ubiquinone oxidoreductase subunit B
MRIMMIGLAPCLGVGIYLFGWRSLALVLFCCLVAYLTEVVFETYRGGSPTESILVSGALIGLSLPPYCPYWIAATGTIFGVVFGKQVFGGFGKNIFNPAIVGRCFLYVCFPIPMTSQWMTPGTLPFGRLASYTAADAITSATPLIAFKQSGVLTDPTLLFLGNIAGSIGETSAAAILLGGAYIIFRKVADWRYPLSCLLGAASINIVLHLAGVQGVMDPVRNIFAGSLLFGAFFMVTEPVSGCVKKEAKWVYGFLIGVLWIVIRSFSSFPEATAFAILLGNTFGPLFDEAVTILENKRKTGAAARSSAAGASAISNKSP